VRLLTTVKPSRSSFPATFGSITRLMPRASARLTALPARFRSPLTIVREVARAMLTADMTGTNCLLVILGEVPRVPGVLLLSHFVPPELPRKISG
jgi:hypothetical protein